MPNNPMNPSELDEILYASSNYWGRYKIKGLPRLDPNEARQAIKDLMIQTVKTYYADGQEFLIERIKAL